MINRLPTVFQVYGLVYSMLVIISLNPLKAGMFGTVSFNSSSKGDKLFIPRDALLGSVKDAQVFVIENDIAHLRNIVVGNTFDKSLEVLKGLKAGETVVVNGQNNLVDNYRVTVVQ